MTEEKEAKTDMTDESEAAGKSSSWLSPWISAAKAKSSEVLEFMKKDFEEISTIVKSEANSVVNSTTNVLKNTIKHLEEPESTANSMKKSFSSFFDNLSNVLNPLPDDECQEALQIQNDVPVPLSRIQLKICELIKNPDTFLNEIDQSQMPQFESWLGISEERMTMDKLTKLLVASPDLHNQYELLVPERVSHLDFWKRYLFRKALLEDEESLREARERRNRSIAEKVQWENEDFAQDLELTEDEQIKILSDYEKEKTKGSKVKTQSKGESSDLIMHEKQDMVVIGDASLASSSSADTEADWEKDFEIKDEAE